MKKTLMIEKRKKAQQLRAQGWSIRKIARYLAAGKDNVTKWLKMTDEEIEQDKRGWPRGKMRKHSEEEKRRVLELLEQLNDENGYYMVPRVVKENYVGKFQGDIPEWFIRAVMKECGESKVGSTSGRGEDEIKDRGYPENSWKKLGKVVMKVKFFEMQPFKGSARRAAFLSCRYIRPYDLGFVYGVSGQTSREVIRVLKTIWNNHAVPDLVIMNYAPAFGANLSQRRCIGKVTLFLLNLGIKPFYTSSERECRKKSEREGDRIFSDGFWRTLSSDGKHKKNIKIERFFLRYSGEPDIHSTGKTAASSIPKIVLKYWDIENRNIDQLPESRIYFLRIVRKVAGQNGGPETGYVDILGIDIELTPELIGYRVLGKLNLKSKTLTVSLHNQNGRDLLKIAKKVPFEVSNVD